MGAQPQVVDETTLDVFRGTYLSPDALYEQVLAPGPGNPVLLLSGPPGLGKTFSAHGLIARALQGDHDLVVFIAPTRALIAELLASDAARSLKDQTVVLERRPKARCGEFDPAWSQLEQSGCAALAKATLCGNCPRVEDCGWPDQFDRIDATIRLVICTEAYLTLNPSLIRRVVKAAQAKRPLVVFDEASFMTARQVKSVTLDGIAQFKSVLTAAQRDVQPAEAARLAEVVEALALLLDAKDDLAVWPRISSFAFIGATLAIQQAGRRLFGDAFRYIGPDLAQLTSGRNAARWFAEDSYDFVPLPQTDGCDVVIFSPYLPTEIIEERLVRPVVTVLPGAVFRHSETKVINITDPVGALRTLSSEDHFGRVADFFTALVLRDRSHGRRAVVVTKKVLAARLKRHIEAMADEIGQPLRCYTMKEFTALPPGTPVDVVVLTYGVVGINSLERFDALYCFGGYYARQAQLDQTYNQLLPPADQIDLAIRTQNGRREVFSGAPDARSRYHARRARAVLEMIERRVVLQAVGRVRPFTTPATVITFQQDDLSGAFGDIETFARMTEARSALKVPTRAQLLRAALGDRLRPDHVTGLSQRLIAKQHGIPLSTVHRALAMPPLEDLIREGAQ